MSLRVASTNDVREIERRLGPKGRRCFTPAGWNKALRDAMVAAGNWWIGNYGVLRFNPGYAVSVLRYKVGQGKRRRMARGEAPFFSTGQFQNGFNFRSRTEATATKGRVRGRVVIPGGFLNFHPDHVATFRSVPLRERKAVAREFRRALIQAVQTGRAEKVDRDQAKAQAKAKRIAENKQYRSAVKANKSVGRANLKAQKRADRASVRAAARQLRRQRTRKATIKLKG